MIWGDEMLIDGGIESSLDCTRRVSAIYVYLPIPPCDFACEEEGEGIHHLAGYLSSLHLLQEVQHPALHIWVHLCRDSRFYTPSTPATAPPPMLFLATSFTLLILGTQILPRQDLSQIPDHRPLRHVSPLPLLSPHRRPHFTILHSPHQSYNSQSRLQYLRDTRSNPYLRCYFLGFLVVVVGRGEESVDAESVSIPRSYFI